MILKNSDFGGTTESCFFSTEALRDIQSKISMIFYNGLRLRSDYVQYNFKSTHAQEHARHGFARRISTLTQCVKNIFETLPPELTSITLPKDDKLSDATINIQAFIINVFGCIDNLAWILVHEKSLKRKDGAEIPETWVGLRESNTCIRDQLSSNLQRYLNGLNGWFKYLENYRHPLAHQIPLYIPPYTEFPNNGLKLFEPCICGSFQSPTKPIIFHEQLLADFYTVDELAQNVLKELREENAS